MEKNMKKRLDTAVFELSLAPTREKAKALIMAGSVYVNGQKATKAGDTVSENDIVELKGETQRYVSRGGYKLEKAIDRFGISLKGSVCIDMGSSTGGFTDCMLQNGATKVYSVDVGHGQLDWKLRNDSRVVVMERTNVRYLNPEDITDEIDFISIDVSFISLRLVLPVAADILKNGGSIVCLIKPQFEAGKEKVGKNGVVKDPKVHTEVSVNIAEFAESIGLSPAGFEFSPITGPKGNIEYLIYLKKTDAPSISSEDIIRCVCTSHEILLGERIKP